MPRRNNRCVHDKVVCQICVVPTDAAKRIHETINVMHIARTWEELSRGWMAFKLEDGTTDNVLYDSRADAIKHQLHEQQCLYIAMRTTLGGVPVRDCQILIDVHRHIYDAGGRLADPQAPDIIMSTYGHDVLTGRVNPYAAQN
jgi:hypothetical protein